MLKKMKKFWYQFVMSHFMALSKLEKNLSKWNKNCRNDWDIVANDRRSEKMKQMERAFDKVESILDKAWKDHIKKHVKWGMEITYHFDIEENEYDITSEDINVFKHLGKTISFKNRKYHVYFATDDGTLYEKRLKVSVTI